MRRTLLGLVFLLAACTPPASPPVTEPEPESVEEPAEGGAGGAEESPVPERLTGLPGIDRAQDLDMRILDARGNGRLGDRALVSGQTAPLTTGEWLLSEAGSEYEMTFRSSLLPDGIVRLDGRSAFLVEPPVNGLPRFRVFAGHASFYLPHLPQGVEMTVLTPAGPLITHGAAFTVTVSPDFQVLVTCREGAVYLTGAQNAVAQPGQAIVADRHGRGRLYSMTPNEALPFTSRWLAIMSEESGPLLRSVLPRRLAEWKTASAQRDSEALRFTALWFREARTVLGPSVPEPEVWNGALAAEVRRSVWHPPPRYPGLLGELP